MKQISVRLNDELLAAIDRAAGDVPRERWIRNVLAEATSEHRRPSHAWASDTSLDERRLAEPKVKP